MRSLLSSQSMIICLVAHFFLWELSCCDHLSSRLGESRWLTGQKGKCENTVPVFVGLGDKRPGPLLPLLSISLFIHKSILSAGFWRLAFPRSTPLPVSRWSFFQIGGDSWLPCQLPAGICLAPLMHKLDMSPNDLRPQRLKPDRLWGLTHLLVMIPLWGKGAVILFIKIFLMFNLHFIRLHLILPLQQFSWAKESIY